MTQFENEAQLRQEKNVLVHFRRQTRTPQWLLSSQTANSSLDTDTDKRRQTMSMVLRKNQVISKNTVC